MQQEFTPALGFKLLTPVYDLVIAAVTREKKWRRLFLRKIAPTTKDRILDIGSGTGSLAVALFALSPKTRYLGIDPDAEIVALARKKATRANADVVFQTGFFCVQKAVRFAPNKIISSLVLHQVPIDEKRRIIEQIFQSLPKNGTVHIADYGEQKTWVMRLLFRLTVQLFDGVTDTQPNADGILLELLKKSGFLEVEEQHRIFTLTGTICIYRGQKP